MKYLFFFVGIIIPVCCLCTPAKVIRIIDGDTFVIETGEHVRIVGINAPEMKTIYGEPAKEHLALLIGGKTVDLENDHISANKDVYGRLLRYIYYNGIDIDKQMVKDGYAVAFLKYRFDKQEEYKQTELDARQASIGIWQNSGRDITKKKYNYKGFRITKNTGSYIRAVLVILIVLLSAIFLLKKYRNT